MLTLSLVLAQRNPLDSGSRNADADLQKYITALEQGDVDTETLQNIVLLCLVILMTNHILIIDESSTLRPCFIVRSVIPFYLFRVVSM